MIKTVFLSSDYPSNETIDNQINSWLAENPDIKLIDIKFQSNVSAVADSGVSAEYWHTSALIIYKADNKGAEIKGVVVNKEKIDDMYTITIRNYGVFVVSQEKYNSLKIGDEVNF